MSMHLAARRPRLALAGRAATVAVAVALGLSQVPARAVEPLVQHDVVLLQAGSLLAQRIDGGADAMGDYLQRLGDAATAAMRATPQQLPTAGFIVVAIRPGGRAHAWFDFKPALSEAAASALVHAVEATPPTPVKSGDVVFALRVSVWGAKPPAAYAPAPPEWKDAAKAAGHKLDLDTLVDQLWPR